MVLTSKKVWPPPDEPRSDVAQTAIQAVLVSCSRNTRYFVAIKMGRRHGGHEPDWRSEPDWRYGSISKPIRDRSGGGRIAAGPF
jgi:hypothetical protein